MEDLERSHKNDVRGLEIIPVHEREVYSAAGYGQQVEFGSNPGLLVVDSTYNFTGDRPEPILESVKRFGNSCGEVAWRSLEVIAELQSLFRTNRLPVVMTRGPRKTPYLLGGWARTHGRSMDAAAGDDPGERFPDVIAPAEQDIVMEKTKPSAFFGTPLVSILHELGVDTLMICGGTTSGCVRATVIDAFSYGYRVGVVREATFDRASVPHMVNLFDIEQKYGNVLTSDDVQSYVESL